MRISRTQNHLPRRGALLSLASTAAVFASGISSGADITWSAATGDFSFAGNWTGGVVPFDGDNAVIDNGGTAGIGGSLTVAGLHTGSVAGGGTFRHTAGDLVVLNAVRLGVSTGSTGSFSSEAGSLHQGEGDFIIAEGAGSTASFALAADVSFTRGAGTITVGRLGTGTFSMAGSLTSSGDFIVGDRSIPGSSSTGTVTHTGGTFVSNGGIFIGSGDQQQGVNGIAGTYDLPGAVIIANGAFSVGTGGAAGLLKMSNGFIGKSPAGPIVVGEGNGAEGAIEQSSGFINCGGDFILGSGASAAGSYVMETGSQGAPSMVIGGSFVLGEDGGSAVLDLKGGTITKTSAGSGFAFASGQGSSATITIDSGRLVNIGGETWLGAAGNGTATWTLSGIGEAVVTLLELGHADTAVGTLNLDGGLLSVDRITQGISTAASTVNFNGGILRANGSTGDFMSGISAVNVGAGGVVIDTNGFEIAVSQTLADAGGGLSKTGDGRLTLEGNSNYIGDTIIQQGTLAMNGTLPVSPVWVNSGATLAGNGTIGGSVTVVGAISPGDNGGELSVGGNVEFPGGVLKPVFDGALVAPLEVGGELNIEGATLDLTGATLLAGTYTIATFDTMVGTEFMEVTGLPAGFSVTVGADAITISGAPAASPYEAWAASKGLEGEDAAGSADPDDDGIPNAIEFVVGGNPGATGDASKLPAGEVEDGKFVFSFRRTAESAGTPPIVEYGSDLDDSWTTATDGTDGVTIMIAEDVPTGDEVVTVGIPMAPGRLFARLRVDIP